MTIDRDGSSAAAAPSRTLPTLRKSFHRIHLIIAVVSLLAGLISLLAMALEKPHQGGQLPFYLWPLLLLLSVALLVSGLIASFLTRRLNAELERWHHHLTRENDTLAHQALHDTLTGLPNRAVFTYQLEKRWLDLRERQRIAVLFIDGNRFKEVNDRFGHAAGDRVLRVVAQRLRARLRKDDLVARLGGDEFAILLTSIDREEQAAQVARDITAEMRQPVKLGDGTLLPQTLSIGVALGKHHQSTEVLLAQADSAMYQIKQRGGGWFLSPSFWELTPGVPPEGEAAPC
ncbi:diguanylate cyclase [Erwinia sp. S38]|uniref:diguanylate cyclase domain-containing protein n=1 Tax=Erwinia sp. S38 TaxID=2769338 RepID=UPI001909FF33|nr:GGDEF domain-containing protein [Erwinia sp. S38]